MHPFTPPRSTADERVLPERALPEGALPEGALPEAPLPEGTAALSLPPAPAEPARPGFGWVAATAPVLGAVVLWALTGSPIALALAALGPVVAVAVLLDGRRQAAAARRRAAAARSAQLDALRDEVHRRHRAQHAAAWRRTPPVRVALAEPAGGRWHGAGPAVVVLGRGPAPSATRVAGAPLDDRDRALVRAASRVADLPVLGDPSGGLGLVGPQALARAAARAAVVQLARHASPGTLAISAPQTADWEWTAVMPHRAGGVRAIVTEDGEPPPATVAGTGRDAPEVWPITIAGSSETLPPGLRTVLRVESPARAVLERLGGEPDGRVVVPELVSVAEARSWAVRALRAAERAGRSAGSPPAAVPFDALVQPAPRRRDRASLAVVVGVAGGPDGAVEVDLVQDGPHALLAGTSGSGKSELLVTWLTALASVYPPELVAFLLVDFKGGAAFEPLRGLPHVAGIVTDLDEAEAVRAVESLRAELRHREQVLSDAGAREIAGLGHAITMPRLVIVVDEFQAMIERFPDLGPLIGDIASRGRSLGVHLVLAAQRPNGVVRESVAANCGLRISLRVLQRADSLAVVGVDRAAELDPACPGRAVLARDGATVEFQAASVSPDTLAAVRARTDGPAARRPWLDPLPTRIPPSELDSLVAAGGGPVRTVGVPFGVADEPDRQRRTPAVWLPVDDGPLLVVGVPGSGRSSALRAVAHGFAGRLGPSSVVVVGGAASRQWDLLHAELERVRQGAAVGGPDADRLLLIDDLDARYRAWPEEYRFQVAETIEALVREGRAYGVEVAASAVAARAMPPGLREAFGAPMLLRHHTRADLAQAGGVGALWAAGDPPGAGQWRGRRVQVVDVPVTDGAPAGLVPADARLADLAQTAPPLELAGDRPVAVVSRAPAIDAETLRAATGREVELLRPPGPAALVPGRAPIIVGDVDAWSAGWGVLAAVRDRGDLVVHAGTAEYRAVVRDRTLPPLLDPGAPQCWLVVAGRAPSRRTWPNSGGPAG